MKTLYLLILLVGLVAILLDLMHFERAGATEDAAISDGPVGLSTRLNSPAKEPWPSGSRLKALLPVTSVGVNLKSPSEDLQRHREIFRRLGAEMGEGATDLIAERNYKNDYYLGMALTEALLGWMEVDREAALAGFRDLMTQNPGSRALMNWKGRDFLSGLG